MVLASIGLHGLISYALAQRAKELGIRIALGAQKGDIIRLVTIIAGLLVGTLELGPWTRFIAALLFANRQTIA